MRPIKRLIVLVMRVIFMMITRVVLTGLVSQELCLLSMFFVKAVNGMSPRHF